MLKAYVPQELYSDITALCLGHLTYVPMPQKNNNSIKCLAGPQFTQAKSTAHARRTHRYWNQI